MPSNTPYRRSNRSRPSRQVEQSDAVVVALTVQVILCILLLLVAVLAKKADETRYSGIKAQYNVLVTDPVEGEKALTFFTDNEGGIQKVFATLENFISALMSRFAGGEVAPPIEVEPETPSALEEEPTPQEPTEAPAFDYDYLDTSEVIYTAALGQGGAFPVSEEDMTNLLPPDGSTYAAVALSGKLLPPVTGLITSDFAYRYHPVSGKSDFHTGIDIAAEEGRDILAALPGEVVEVGESDVYGNYMILQHATNLRTFYAHCSEIIATEGMAVRQGERIAKVGQTGTTTGPHLHFSVIVEDKFTDPYWVLQDNIKLVDQ